MKFEVGDIVSFGGVEGRVISVADYGDFPVECVFNATIVYFTIDGRYSKDHIEPLLKFVRRPKKKVKKTFWFVSWALLDGCRDTSCLYLNRYMTNDLHKDKKDRQLHSIEIEVDDE